MKFKSILNILQLNLKWVRIMIVLSALTVVILFIIPSVHENKQVPIKVLHTLKEEAKSDTIVSIPQTVQAPIEIKIISEKVEKPFDWKGTITWVIGALNGIILVVLNIKNILKRK